MNKILQKTIILLCVTAQFSIAKEPASSPKKVPQNFHRTAVANCPNTTAQFDLDINNVRARILNGGDLWWDPIGQINYYEVPIGSNKNSLYSGAI